MSKVNVRRIGYAAGAEITGVDGTEPLDPQTVEAIRTAWRDNIAVYLPGQDLDAAQFRAFCASFGELDTYNIRRLNSLAGMPDIIVRASQPIVVEGKTTKKSSAADRWHSDYSYAEQPSVVTFLLGKDMPSVGGDTMFANMYMAWEALSPAYQRLIEPLSAVHDYPVGAASFPTSPPEIQARYRAENPPVIHPVVRVHPETGRKSLYVDAFVRNFVGMTEEESKPLIDFLMAHATRYEFIYRHRWAVNDLVMWDNRYALHFAVPDFDESELRRTFRASLVGPKTGIVLEEQTAAPVAAAAG